jgi:hypothetical protein
MKSGSIEFPRLSDRIGFQVRLTLCVPNGRFCLVLRPLRSATTSRNTRRAIDLVYTNAAPSLFRECGSHESPGANAEVNQPCEAWATQAKRTASRYAQREGGSAALDGADQRSSPAGLASARFVDSNNGPPNHSIGDPVAISTQQQPGTVNSVDRSGHHGVTGVFAARLDPDTKTHPGAINRIDTFGSLLELGACRRC